MTLREPPYNLEAEQELLGGILVNNDVFHRVSDWLAEDHFYDPLHGRIYATAARLILAKRKATPISLKSEFADEKPVGELTVPQYLGRLAAMATLPAVAWEHGRTVYDLARRRQLVDIGHALICKAVDSPIETDPDALVEQAEIALAALAEKGRSTDHLVTLGDAALDTIDTMAAAYARDGKMAGESTGLYDLDVKTGGLAPAQLIILAARPGMGKTALAINIAYHNARRYVTTNGEEGCPVGAFSVEMSAREILYRMFAGEVGIPADRLRRGDFTEEDYHEMVRIAEERFGPTPLYFDEAGGISINQLCARARRMKRRHGIGLLIVDYLQLVAGSQRSFGRNQEVTEITNGLKALAKELEIPVLALSQLSRECEKRGDDKRPQLADLRDSGSIEQDADVVIFIYREEYYLAKREPEKTTAAWFDWQNEMRAAANKAELIIPKQRQGPTGMVEVHFNGELTKFSNLVRKEHREKVETL